MRDKGAMIPMKHSTIFRNRWWAVLWAAGIVYTAIQIAGPDPKASADGNNSVAAASGETDALGQPVDDEQVRKIAARLDDLQRH